MKTTKHGRATSAKSKEKKIVALLFNPPANLVCIQIKLKHVIQTYLIVLKNNFPLL